ncbi:MAG TPA: hypothetical protein VI282_07175 [Verrucomicrobiae bacterium]
MKEPVAAQRILNVRFEVKQSRLEKRFPEDLREWITESDLARIVEHVTQRLNSESPALLALVTYYYATGQYSSEDIEEVLPMCPLVSVNELSFHETDVASVIRHFRRSHHTVIEESLDLVLRAISPNTSPFEIQNEATERVTQAIQSDCWALDN